MPDSVATTVNVTPQISLGSADAAAASVQASENLAAALVKSSQIQAATLSSIVRPDLPEKKPAGGIWSNPINLGLAGVLLYLAIK